jgi:hypothetical protein
MSFAFGWRDAITLVGCVFCLAVFLMEVLTVVLTCAGEWGLRHEERTDPLWTFICNLTVLAIFVSVALLLLY